jgi:biotin carboxyl carrier protein
VPNERRAASSAKPTPGGRDTRADGEVRTRDERLEDHAAIDRLLDDLLPALAAKLAATHLGEVEVREGGWKIRLRRPADGVVGGRRAGDRSRSQLGHDAHGLGRGTGESGRGLRSAAVSSASSSSSAASAASGALGGSSSNGSGHVVALPVGPGRPEDEGRRRESDPLRVVATSPAVGIYQPLSQLTPGTRVRAGDRIGSVNMLGVPQEVVAPGDGVIGASFVDPGDPVEYGQELVAIELMTVSSTSNEGADGLPGGSLGGGA